MVRMLLWKATQQVGSFWKEVRALSGRHTSFLSQVREKAPDSFSVKFWSSVKDRHAKREVLLKKLLVSKRTVAEKTQRCQFMNCWWMLNVQRQHGGILEL